MKKRKGLLPLCLLASMAVSAQDIATEMSTIDLGRVLFRQPATATFELRNSGKTDLNIDQVRTNCGCTVVDFPSRSVPEGQAFILNATYDAKQLGHFEKLVGIYANGAKEPFILRLKGIVVSPDDHATVDYAHQLGVLSVDKDNIEFDDVNRGDRPVQQIRILNNSDKSVEPVVMHLPSYLTATVAPRKIAPGRTGTATIMLDSHGLHSYGLTQTSIYLGANPGDKVAENKELTVSTVLLPERQMLSADQRIHAPLLKLSADSVDLGKFSKKTKLRAEVQISNIGKSTLDVQSLQMFTAGLKLSLSSQRIAPGQSAKLRITGHRDALRRAKSQPRILMITNDPDHPKVVINIAFE